MPPTPQQTTLTEAGSLPKGSSRRPSIAQDEMMKEGTWAEEQEDITEDGAKFILISLF